MMIPVLRHVVMSTRGLCNAEASYFSGREFGERGAAGIEFALTATLFFTILFGIAVYGLYFFTLVAITNATAEAARASIAGITTAARTTLATTAANTILAAYSPLINSSNATVAAAQVAGNSGFFQVTITYNFGALGLGILGGLIPMPPTNPAVTIVVSNGG